MQQMTGGSKGCCHEHLLASICLPHRAAKVRCKRPKSLANGPSSAEKSDVDALEAAHAVHLSATWLRCRDMCADSEVQCSPPYGLQLSQAMGVLLSACLDKASVCAHIEGHTTSQPSQHASFRIEKAAAITSVQSAPLLCNRTHQTAPACQQTCMHCRAAVETNVLRLALASDDHAPLGASSLSQCTTAATLSVRR